MTISQNEYTDLKVHAAKALRDLDNLQDALTYWKDIVPCAIHGFPEIESRKGSRILYHLPQFKLKINPWIQSFINLSGISPNKGINLLLHNIWNYPKALQAAQVSIVGNYGTGKSNLVNFLVAQHLAKGYRGITFIDRRFEIRNLMSHAWIDWQGEETPFIIKVFLPENYEFTSIAKSERPNISYSYVDDPMVALDSLSNHDVVAIYTDCYQEDDGSKLRLLDDVFEELQLMNNLDNPVIFFHQELSTLIPETPTEGLAKLARSVSDKALNLRKDDITMITSFHMLSEVYYRVSQKFGFVLQKEPVNRRIMSPCEKAARDLPVNGVLVSRSGYWVPHKVGYFPEAKDRYRILPTRKKINYKLPVNDRKGKFSTKQVTALLRLKEGVKQDDIAKEVGIEDTRTIRRWKEKFIEHGLLEKKNRADISESTS